MPSIKWVISITKLFILIKKIKIRKNIYGVEKFQRVRKKKFIFLKNYFTFLKFLLLTIYRKLNCIELYTKNICKIK